MAASATELAYVREEVVRHGSQSLASLAQSSRAALGADAVVIAVRRSRGSAPSIGADGIGGREASRVQRALARLEPALAEGRPVLVSELAADPLGAWLSWAALGFQTLVSAGLSWEGKALGEMHVLNADPTRVGEDGGGAVAVAKQVALAIAYARLQRKTTRLSAELESVMALDELVLQAKTIDEMGHLLTERLAAILGAATSGIMVYDEERGVLQTLPGAFAVSDDDAASYRIKVDHPRSNSARVFTSGKPYVSNEAQGDPGIMQDYVDLFHVERLLSLPLQLGGRKVGLLHLANKPAPFTAYDVYRAQMLAPRIATVVELGTTMLRLRRHQQATEVLVDTALGIGMGKDVTDLVTNALGRLGDVIETSILAVAFPSGAPIVWKRPGVAADLVDRLLGEASKRSTIRPGLGEPREAGDPGYATLFVPVRLSGKQIATVATLRRRAEPFTRVERDVLVRTANLIAVGWATEGYQRQRVEVATLRERQRIADDLHDTVAQLIFAAHLDLDSVLEAHQLAPDAEAGIVRARSLMLKGDAAIRNVIHQLSRPIRGDLSQRLGLMVDSLEEEFQMGIRLEIPPAVGEAAKRLRRPVADALVKTAREAAVNAFKHASPCSIAIRLSISRRGRLVLCVTDDGPGRRGRSRSRKGYGLDSVRRSLRECGGVVRVSAGRSGGTKVIASVPL